MQYLKFKNYDTIDEFYDGYCNDFFHPLYVIFNNIIVFVYKKSKI